MKYKQWKVVLRRTKKLPCPDCSGKTAEDLWEKWRGKTVTVDNGQILIQPACGHKVVRRVAETNLISKHDELAVRRKEQISTTYVICGHFILKELK